MAHVAHRNLGTSTAAAVGAVAIRSPDNHVAATVAEPYLRQSEILFSLGQQ